MKQDAWCLTTPELVREIARRAIAPTSESPLAALPPVADAGPAAAGSGPTAAHGPGPAHLPDRGPRFARLLGWVAAPSLEVGVLRGPGQDAGPEWLYRARDAGVAFAAYGRGPDGDHRFAWTDEDALLADVRASLQLQVPAPPGRLALELDARSFASLVGAIDALREHELQSLLARLPDRACVLDATAVADALGRSCATGDLRWLAALGQAIAPFDVDTSDRACADGLARLDRLGLLAPRRDGGFEPRPALLELAARVGAPVGYAALHVRSCDGSGRAQEHVAALRGLGGLLLLEFAGIGSTEPHVSVRDATVEEVELALLGCFTGGDHCFTGGDQPRPATCGACGRPLKPAARFCTSCGTPRDA